MTRGWLVCVLAVLALGHTASLAQDSLWSRSRAKMVGNTGYSLQFDYEGEEGAYRFRYAVVGDGQKILTEILDGSARGSGSKILYDPSVDRDTITVKSSILTLRRSVASKDIQGSSLYQPLFRQLVEELAEPNPRERLQVGQHVILVFGDKSATQHRLEIDAQGNPVSFRELHKGHESKKMTFRDLRWEAAIVWP